MNKPYDGPSTVPELDLLCRTRTENTVALLKDALPKYMKPVDSYFLSKSYESFILNRRFSIYLQKRFEELVDWAAGNLFPDSDEYIIIQKETGPLGFVISVLVQARITLEKLGMQSCAVLPEGDRDRLLEDIRRFLDMAGKVYRDEEELQNLEKAIRVRILKKYERTAYSILVADAADGNINESNFIRQGSWAEKSDRFLRVTSDLLEEALRAAREITDPDEAESINDADDLNDKITLLKLQLEEAANIAEEYRDRADLLQVQVEQLKACLSSKPEKAPAQKDGSEDEELRLTRKKVSDLESELRSRDEEKARAEETIEALRKRIRIQSGRDNESHIDYNLKYLFIGGRFEVNERLKTIFPNAKTVTLNEDVPNGNELAGYDMVVYLTTFVSHSDYGKARRLAGDIPELHTTAVGIKAILRDMENYFSRQAEERETR